MVLTWRVVWRQPLRLLTARNHKVQQKCLKAVSMALISKVGGASGPLYGSAFMGMMKAEQAGQDLAGVLEAGLEMIKNVVMHKLVKRPWWMFGIRLLKLSNKVN